MKRATAWSLAFVFTLALAGCNVHTESRNDIPQISENIDIMAQLSDETSLAPGTSDEKSGTDLLSDIYQPNLTLQTLQDLVNHYGDALTWDDFTPYYSEESSSSLYILRYPISWDYCLLIGGSDPDSPPMYIRLVSEYDTERWIDVRFDNLDDFINLAPKTSEFSYEEVLAEHRENDPGVKYSGFHNTSRVALETIGDVLERAKGECTIHYDTADVSHDDGASVWQIVFYTKEAAGGDQAVYMDSYGVTCLLVYGE